MGKGHHASPIFTAGAPLSSATAALILLHGRGASAQDILALVGTLTVHNVAFLAPQAANSQWYPNRFLAPVASNEPWLSSALSLVDALVGQCQAAGLTSEQICLLGFSQGACLALEFTARHPKRYGGVFGLSGALIENGDQPREYTGDLAQTPVFLGCSDVDFHVPLERVQRSSEIFRNLGAAVTERIYPGMGHTVNQDEIEFINATIQAVQTKV
jgi:phospholipase/carboxylesterase